MADTLGNGIKSPTADPSAPPTCEAVQRWIANLEAHDAKCRAANSAAAIAQMAGIPEWLVLKVVSLELERRVYEKLKPTVGSEKETLACIITESISYSRELTREDGWHHVWPRRRMEMLKAYLREYTDLTIASRNGGTP